VHLRVANEIRGVRRDGLPGILDIADVMINQL
jgi:hypothetical protein